MDPAFQTKNIKPNIAKKKWLFSLLVKLVFRFCWPRNEIEPKKIIIKKQNVLCEKTMMLHRSNPHRAEQIWKFDFRNFCRISEEHGSLSKLINLAFQYVHPCPESLNITVRKTNEKLIFRRILWNVWRTFCSTSILIAEFVQLFDPMHIQQQQNPNQRTKETTTKERNNAFDWRSRPTKKNDKKKK